MEFDKEGICRLSYNGADFLNLKDKTKPIGGGIFCENAQYRGANGVVTDLWDGPKEVKHNTASRTSTLQYQWGQVSASYTVSADTLRINVVIRNQGTGTLLGVNTYPIRLRFPQLPKGFIENYAYFNTGNDGPQVTIAEGNVAKIAFCNEDVTSTAFNGMQAENAAGAIQYKYWISNIPYPGMPQKIKVRKDTIGPGMMKTYTLSLRFGSKETSIADLTRTICNRYAVQWPRIATWSDKRPIGYMVLSSVENKGSSAKNKRGWLPGQNVDLSNEPGKKAFSALVLERAKASLLILKGMNAQGVITWDIEGQEYPHPISYIGTPELLPTLAPEMDVVADAYFAIYRNANLKTGICIRPDSVYFNSKTGEVVRLLPKGNASTVDDYVRSLYVRIRYARKRWGCTIFYVDSNLEEGIPMNPEVFRKLAIEFPDVLIIPEHESDRYFAYTSPLVQLRSDGLPNLQLSRSLYPGSFSVVSVAEGMRLPDGKWKYKESELAELIRDNVLLFRAWYDDPENKVAIDLKNGAPKN